MFQKKVISTVSKFTKVKMADIFSESRKENIVLAKQMSMYLLKRRLGLSFSEIGKMMARNKKPFHHTSVMSNVNVFQNRLDTKEDNVIEIYTKVLKYLDLDDEFPKEKGPKILVYYPEGFNIHNFIKVLNTNFTDLSYEFE